MNEIEKPFVCTNDGCEMKFTNEDHLNVHRKKHMVLNLGLATKNVDVADQTPTPTRFIRNCEEVGLFQDLQNVNPFEETFKKAIENGKCGALHIPDTSSDDTLHTPHIFPHIEEESTVKFLDHETENQPHEFNINNVPAIDTYVLKFDNKTKGHETTVINLLANENSDNAIVDKTNSNKKEMKKIKLDLLSEGSSNIKQQVRAALKSKLTNDYDRELEDRQVPTIKIINTDKASQNKTNLKNNGTTSKHYHIMTSIEKRRALNRAAQLRSRARKKQRVKDMENEMTKLKVDYKELLVRYESLKNENAALKMILLEHESCSVAKDPAIIEKTRKILNAPKVLPVNESPPKTKTMKKIKPVLPVPKNTLQNIIELPIVLTTIPTIQTTTLKTVLQNNKLNNSSLTAVPIITAANITKTT